MIRFIKVEELLPIRNDVLREGKLTNDECRFPSDQLEGAFHLGYFFNDELACVVSLHPQNYGEFAGPGYQLRGMATLEPYRGKGFGNQLVNFALVYLRGQRANYVWCNARKKAVQFYLNVGFEVISPEFEVPGIGPHHVMYVKIK
ncbi:GNAT family N-acetyltransferase [Mucilaginibacter gotjawali]|uniref:GNAT family N-acyltransferase n=1 Tax=Mucilaginibacter gotjawali TaxID=1550579 RepID=A0A839SFJ4_9SPHI|nr:GNAT family N-acetyltransferase [Mucilaginibacter gotjawali]MBB3057075.1 putative GNAT family N-acyltransferase [Mucilaginibacter gotjawali]